MKNILIILILGCMAETVLASFPVNEGFDNYLAGQTFVVATNGWQADTDLVQVVSEFSTNTANSVKILAGTLTNNVNQGSAPNIVWTDFFLKPVLGLPPSVDSTNGARTQLYFTTNGYIAVASTTGFQLLTNDVFGRSIVPINTNSFHRLSIYQDLGSTNSALLLNGVVIYQDLHCLSSSPSYNRLAVQSLDQAAYFDGVSISTAVPLSGDGNGDGMADALELQTYGYVARTNLTVGAGMRFSTLQAAINAARGRDTIVMVGTLLNESLTIDHNVTIAGASFTNTGTCVVQSGGTLTLKTGFDNIGAMTVAGDLGAQAPLQVASLAFSGSGVLAGSNSSLEVSDRALNLSGTFTITAAAWNNSQTTSVLPFLDNFEHYAAGTPFSNLWFEGWGASSATDQVVSSPVFSGIRAAQVSGVLSNRVDGTGVTRVWTDFYLRPRLGLPPDTIDTNTASVLFYVDTNGCLNLYNTGHWDVLSNGVLGAVAPVLAEGGYSRITLFSDFNTEQAAIFVNGQLLRQKVPFPRGQAMQFYRALQVANLDGNAYLDQVTIGAQVPSGMTGDANGNGMPDADEINIFGRLYTQGAIYLIR